MCPKDNATLMDQSVASGLLVVALSLVLAMKVVATKYCLEENRRWWGHGTRWSDQHRSVIGEAVTSSLQPQTRKFEISNSGFPNCDRWLKTPSSTSSDSKESLSFVDLGSYPSHWPRTNRFRPHPGLDRCYCRSRVLRSTISHCQLRFAVVERAEHNCD